MCGIVFKAFNTNHADAQHDAQHDAQNESRHDTQHESRHDVQNEAQNESRHDTQHESRHENLEELLNKFNVNDLALRSQLVNVRARGPDAHTYEIYRDSSYVYRADFFRLSIVGGIRGSQPYIMGDINGRTTEPAYMLMCNGEIYNYKALESQYQTEICSSDCEIIMHLVRIMRIDEVLPLLSGEFAFVLHDTTRGLVHFGTDRIGRKALYYRHSILTDRPFTVASSATACAADDMGNELIVQCKPGILYTWDIKSNSLSEYQWHSFKFTFDSHGRQMCPVSINRPYRLFMEAVYRRITQHDGTRPIGFLLSGGLDSSAVLAAALHLIHDARQACELVYPPQDTQRVPTPQQIALYKLRIVPQVFTIGFDEAAPDVADAARFVAWLKAKYGADAFEWHRVILPISAALEAIPRVIKALETCDTTTVRASVPMFLLSEYIAKTRARVLLSGEGSDELFGGYMYFSHSPNEYATRAEILKLLNELYIFDALRADRSTAAHGLEVRTPFLDDQFVAAALSFRIGQSSALISPTKNVNMVANGQTNALINGQATELMDKQSTSITDKLINAKYAITKPYIRQILASGNLLPDFVLWAKKEAFSDGVGHSWKTAIKQHAESQDAELSKMYTRIIPGLPCDTAEARYFQHIFIKNMPAGSSLLCPKLWLPNQDWVKTGSEPSACILPSYKG